MWKSRFDLTDAVKISSGNQ